MEPILKGKEVRARVLAKYVNFGHGMAKSLLKERGIPCSGRVFLIHLATKSYGTAVVCTFMIRLHSSGTGALSAFVHQNNY